MRNPCQAGPAPAWASKWANRGPSRPAWRLPARPKLSSVGVLRSLRPRPGPAASRRRHGSRRRLPELGTRHDRHPAQHLDRGAPSVVAERVVAERACPVCCGARGSPCSTNGPSLSAASAASPSCRADSSAASTGSCPTSAATASVSTLPPSRRSHGPSGRRPGQRGSSPAGDAGGRRPATQDLTGRLPVVRRARDRD